MTNLTLLPADIAGMSVADLAKLSPKRKHELDANLDAAIAWLKTARAKLDAALELCYGDQAREALRASERDFGTVHIADGPLRIKFELPKKVSWSQKQLTEIAERIVAAGERPEAYLDIKLTVPESRYNNWPPALRQQFADARTAEPGKPSFTLTLDEVAA
ncbi:hypothetical protein [Ralstonia pseudosolanacearum]|nr:hypothetical protein [Ralstonia pseudosolanacearum]APC69959.1 hypothetical protein RSOE_24605 [Ralstonia solanacearum OE1-1]NKA08942.1 hypothetical protein [Ralstonia solanacearum]API73253.1 hypothetical protein AC251_00975 [Ralstonia pseudosolanacearum]ASL72567.1 hypothetical protein BC350_02010 [Ralstonia pseudosolanacearum]AST85131.1 hypothetical protein CIG66_00930 [Ralstonia pseudosolanacearum]